MSQLKSLIDVAAEFAHRWKHVNVIHNSAFVPLHAHEEVYFKYIVVMLWIVRWSFLVISLC